METYPFKKNVDLVNQLCDEALNDPLLSRFLLKHDISSETLELYLSDLLTYKKEIARCDNCPGLDACSQESLGYQPILDYQGGNIRLYYTECPYKKAQLKRNRQKGNVDARYMPKMIHEATLSDFRMDTAVRKDLYHQMIALANQYRQGESITGLYLYGKYQIGKTYALAALANHFSEFGKKVIIAYYPDLVRELKSSIGSGTLEKRIHELKTVEILMLDDIGGENNSVWIRDEVLGPILQHRLLDHMPTFFSSNLPSKELQKNMLDSDQQIEQIKAFRVIERIKALTKEFKM